MLHGRLRRIVHLAHVNRRQLGHNEDEPRCEEGCCKPAGEFHRHREYYNEEFAFPPARIAPDRLPSYFLVSNVWLSLQASEV